MVDPLAIWNNTSIAWENIFIDLLKWISWLFCWIIPLLAWLELPYWLKRNFWKSNWFYVGLLFLTPIFMWILAFDDSKYEQNKWTEENKESEKTEATEETKSEEWTETTTWTENEKKYNFKKIMLIILGVSAIIWWASSIFTYYQYKSFEKTEYEFDFEEYKKELNEYKSKQTENKVEDLVYQGDYINILNDIEAKEINEENINNEDNNIEENNAVENTIEENNNEDKEWVTVEATETPNEPYKENNTTNYNEDTEIKDLQPISFSNNEDNIIERVNYNELNKTNTKKTSNKEWINEILKNYKWNIIMWDDFVDETKDWFYSIYTKITKRTIYVNDEYDFILRIDPERIGYWLEIEYNDINEPSSIYLLDKDWERINEIKIVTRDECHKVDWNKYESMRANNDRAFLRDRLNSIYWVGLQTSIFDYEKMNELIDQHYCKY